MLKRVMKPYQIKALEYLQRRKEQGFKGGTLWMEMRLGKSWVALSFALSQNFQHILIVCPKKPLASWMDECRYNNVDPLIFAGTRDKKITLIHKIPTSRVVVCTYEAARLYWLMADGYKWDCIILDETYKLAKPSSQKSRSMWEWRGNEFRVGLSGNPGAETPLDLIPQYIAVDGNIGPYTKPYDFYEKHTEVDQHGNFKLKKGQEEQIRMWMREHSFCLTRAEAGVGGGKIYGKIYCDMPPNLQKAYNQIVEDRIFEKTWLVGGEKIRLDPMRRMNWLWCLTSGIKPMTGAKIVSKHKIEAVIQWLRESQTLKAVIAAHFVDECEQMNTELRQAGYHSEVMTGKTSMKTQLGVQEGFNSGKINVVVLQQDAFCMGLNFAASDVIIFLSNSLSGDARCQFEDRIIHLSKEYDVLLMDVVCRGGADGYISDMVRDKTTTAKDLITQGAVYLKEIEQWKETDN